MPNKGTVSELPCLTGQTRNQNKLSTASSITDERTGAGSSPQTWGPDLLGIVSFICAPFHPILSENNGHSCRVGVRFFLLDGWMGILTCSGLTPGHDWAPWARGNSYRWRGSSPCDDRMYFAYCTSPVRPSSSVSHLPKEPLRQRNLRFSAAKGLGGANSQGTAWDDDSHFCSFVHHPCEASR